MSNEAPVAPEATGIRPARLTRGTIARYATGPSAGIWVLIAFTLTATAFSLFQVPYIALPAELTPSYDERTRQVSRRVVVLTFAILLFGAGGPALRRVSDDPFVQYLVMGVVCGLVIGIGMPEA